MENDAATLYLELMKKTLTFSMWREPPVPVEYSNATRPAWKRLLLGLARHGLRHWHFSLVHPFPASAQDRQEGMDKPGYAHTMIGMRRLDSLQACVETALRENVPGDLIETGVWRGGACIFMRAVLAAHGVADRRVFVADSFEGLPTPDLGHWPADRGDTYHLDRFFAVSKEEVEANFRAYGLLDAQVVFLQGWFKDTLPAAPIGRLALMRLDGDMYGSTMEALENLYPKLSPGGFCIIDDFSLPGCRQAVDDFRARNGVNAHLVEIDWTGRYWRKS
jgi:hypothetical protein